MVEDLKSISYGLKIYIKGLDVALGKNDVKDVVDYLEKIRKEAEENMAFLANDYNAK